MEALFLEEAGAEFPFTAPFPCSPLFASCWAALVGLVRVQEQAKAVKPI